MNRTFNRILHKILSWICTPILIFYLERIKQIHLGIVYLFIIVSFIHTFAHVINGYNFITYYDNDYEDVNWAHSKNDSIGRLLFGTLTGFSGIAMITILIVMWGFSTKSMRTRFYNVFLYVHHLFLLFLFFLYLHPIRYCSFV